MRNNHIKIITTYEIGHCDLWSSSVNFVNKLKRRAAKRSKVGDLIFSLKSDTHLVLEFFKARKNYDVLFTSSDRASKIFAILQTILGKRIKHVMFNCLWFYPKNRIDRLWRIISFGLVSRSVDKFILYASHEIEDYHKVFRLAKDKFVYIPFYFTPVVKRYKSEEGDYIFSGGHANYRDYKTLLKAVQGLNIKCKIVTQVPEYLENLVIPENVEIMTLSQEEYFLCMAQSRLVVVPLKAKMLRSAGQRSYLDAMLLEKPVVVCDDKGAYDYIDNGKEAFIIRPNDPQLLRITVEKILSNGNNLQEMVEKAKKKASKFTIERTMGQILALLGQVVGG